MEVLLEQDLGVVVDVGSLDGEALLADQLTVLGVMAVVERELGGVLLHARVAAIEGEVGKVEGHVGLVGSSQC